jgi:hypothetical protein
VVLVSTDGFPHKCHIFSPSTSSSGHLISRQTLKVYFRGHTPTLRTLHFCLGYSWQHVARPLAYNSQHWLPGGQTSHGFAELEGHGTPLPPKGGVVQGIGVVDGLCVGEAGYDVGVPDGFFASHL